MAMHTNPKNIIPYVLMESVDYVALTDAQRNNFTAKLRYCEETVEKASSAVNLPDDDLFDVIDDIELDLLSIMSGLSDVKNSVSPYQVHSSWTFEVDRQMMIKYVESDIAVFLGGPPISFGASNDEIRAWLGRWSKTLKLSLDRFVGSSSFTEAVAYLILIDAIIFSYLVSAAIMRLAVRRLLG